MPGVFRLTVSSCTKHDSVGRRSVCFAAADRRAERTLVTKKPEFPTIRGFLRYRVKKEKNGREA